jgi:hypothetical protein
MFGFLEPLWGREYYNKLFQHRGWNACVTGECGGVFLWEMGRAISARLFLGSSLLDIPRCWYVESVRTKTYIVALMLKVDVKGQCRVHYGGAGVQKRCWCSRE